tara:strand:+ start:119 stop:1414 length:1296 start_codon:yes stop_codon:yes gene_type:complete
MPGGGLVAAGVSTLQPEGMSARNAMTFHIRPTTPPEVQKYRRTRIKAGERVVHYGSAEDVARAEAARALLPPEDQAFGRAVPTQGGGDDVHVADVMKAGPTTQFEATKASLDEATYHRNRLEPLGKSYVRGHVLPDEVLQPGFMFGAVPKGGGSGDVKGLLYPRVDFDDDSKHEQLLTSHHAFYPGEQRRRNYGGAYDPTRKFGQASSAGAGGPQGSRGVADALRDDPKITGTVIVSKRQVDAKASLDHPIGRARTVSTHSPHMTFGVSTKGQMGTTAAETLAGSYSLADQLPDESLGRSSRPGWRNITTETRAFGCPTIRRDIPVPARRSVADGKNYGQGASAKSLLYPGEYSLQGVHDSEFVQGRDADVIREIFAGIGLTFSDADFAMLWRRSTLVANGAQPSVEHFRLAQNDFEDAARLGQKPGWWGM